MLYDDNDLEIHAIIDVSEQNEVVDESVDEWCPKVEVNSINIEVDQESESVKSNVPDQLSAAEALSWESKSVDFRPHLYNPITKEWMLVDSGSQITAWPPDPGDKLDPKVRLRAANNTYMKCYGFKDIKIRISPVS